MFARFASRQRVSGGGGRLNAVPLHVYPTKDGPLHAVSREGNWRLMRTTEIGVPVRDVDERL